VKQKLLKSFVIILGGYLLFVALYFCYLHFAGGSGSHYSGVRLAAQKQYSFDMAEAKIAYSNVATLQMARLDSAAVLDQKYEKVANLAASTTRFEADETRLRAYIREKSLLIQAEETRSKEPSRELHMTLGVPPGLFEEAIAQLRTMGKLEDIEVTKTDKTNEYLELNAQRLSFTQTRDALAAMKSKGGRVEEMIRLEQELLNLEQKIQGLGVQLGKFDKVNEFCTVRYKLVEASPAETGPGAFYHFVEALQWAGPVYLIVLVCLLVGLLVVMMVFLVAEKARLLESVK
jgi:hypothetical protein